MTFGEKVDRIIELAGLAPEDAAKVALELGDGEPTVRGIDYVLASLGLQSQAPAR